jgi:hypothetical protein
MTERQTMSVTARLMWILIFAGVAAIMLDFAPSAAFPNAAVRER